MTTPSTSAQGPDESSVTTAMIDAAFRVCPADAASELGTGAMQRIIAAALTNSPSPAASPASPSGARVKPLVWRDHRPDSFPEPAWSAQTPFGFYNIEEVSASDSPAYVVRLHAHHFIADKDSLDEAKAAAQADYETRILRALASAATPDQTSGDAAHNALLECEEYLDNRADADCDQDGFVPNKEMRLLSVVRDALASLAKPASEPAGGDVRAVSSNGKRWRIIPADGDWEMQPVGHITAGQAEALCKRIEAALSSSAAPAEPVAWRIDHG